VGKDIPFCTRMKGKHASFQFTSWMDDLILVRSAEQAGLTMYQGGHELDPHLKACVKKMTCQS
jgi:hypothetical protein